MTKNAVIAGLCLAGCATGVQAADPLGVYLGAEAGQADVRSVSSATPAGPFDESHAGWQAFVGIRPLPFLGAELAYTSLGDPRRSQPLTFGAASDSRQSATSAFGLAYLPAGPIDLYAKLGVSYLHTVQSYVPVCPPGALCPIPTLLGMAHQNLWDTHLTYGVGAQVRAGALAARLEYLRYEAAGEHPDFLGIGLFFQF
jgi:hypothetical protein